MGEEKKPKIYWNVGRTYLHYGSVYSIVDYKTRSSGKRDSGNRHVVGGAIFGLCLDICKSKGGVSIVHRSCCIDYYGPNRDPRLADGFVNFNNCFRYKSFVNSSDLPLYAVIGI